MALIQCHECRGLVSELAPNCFHCGARVISMDIRHKLLDEREELVIRLRDDNLLTFLAIGSQMGVSMAKAYVIYGTAKARLKDYVDHGDAAFVLLPKRVRRLIDELNLGSRAAVRSAIKSGRLSWNMNYGKIQCERGLFRSYGRRTWLDLNKWAGIPVDSRGKSIIKPVVRSAKKALSARHAAPESQATVSKHDLRRR